MVEWAGLVDGETVLEPSAGHGAISRFFSPNTPSVIIEPSSRLAPLAQMNTDGATFSKGSFESYHLVNKFNAVIMNPPYGTAGKTAMEHLEKAFKHLKNGGRLIAIVPNGPSMDKRFDSWYASKEADSAHVVGTVKLPSATFGRAGTGVNTKIIVLDKYNDKSIGEDIYQRSIDLSDAKTVEELFDKIENISMPKRLLPNVKASNPVESANTNKTSAITTNEFFKTDTHLNTRTKKEQYRASITKGVERATYEKIASLAKKNSGYYSSFAKGFLFENATNRDSFVSQAQETFGEEANANTSFSIRTKDMEKDYQQLRKQGMSRPKALDTLVEEYTDQNYDAENPLPGYAQHEELTQEEVENIYRDIDEKLDSKISPYDIVKNFC